MTKRKEHLFKDDIEFKHCSTCNNYKELEHFNLDNKSWDKLRSCCKICIKEQRKKWKESDKTMEDRRNNHYKINDIFGKDCSSCKKWKEIIKYTKSKNNWDKLNRVCKDCCKEKRVLRKEEIKKYKIDNKERFKEYNKNYQY